MSEIKVVINDITRLSAKIAELETEITELEHTIETKDLVISTLTERITSLEGEINTLQGEVVELTSQVESLTTQNQALTQQIQTLNEQISSLNTQIANMNSAIETINGETVLNPISYLAETKAQILTALQSKGSSATSSTPFRQYATEISNIPSPRIGDSHTVLLLHLDSDNQFADSSIYNRPIVTVGSPTIDTTESKFGNGSALLNDACFYVNQTDFYPFSAGYTIEFFLKPTSAWVSDNSYYFFSQNYNFNPTGTSEVNQEMYASSTYSYYQRSNIARMSSYVVGSNFQSANSGGFTFPSDQWTHFAFCKNPLDTESYLRTYVNGTYTGWEGSGIPSVMQIGDRYNLPLPSLSAWLVLFAKRESWGSYSGKFPCHVNELRISDVCRYTGNFTPPTQPFTI